MLFAHLMRFTETQQCFRRVQKIVFNTAYVTNDFSTLLYLKKKKLFIILMCRNLHVSLCSTELAMKAVVANTMLGLKDYTATH